MRVHEFGQLVQDAVRFGSEDGLSGFKVNLVANDDLLRSRDDGLWRRFRLLDRASLIFRRALLVWTLVQIVRNAIAVGIGTTLSVLRTRLERTLVVFVLDSVSVVVEVGALLGRVLVPWSAGIENRRGLYRRLGRFSAPGHSQKHPEGRRSRRSAESGPRQSEKLDLLRNRYAPN